MEEKEEKRGEKEEKREEKEEKREEKEGNGEEELEKGKKKRENGKKKGWYWKIGMKTANIFLTGNFSRFLPHSDQFNVVCEILNGKQGIFSKENDLWVSFSQREEKMENWNKF